MFVAKGDTVILTESDQPHLQPYVGKEWKVEAVIMSFLPASAMLSRGNLQASSYLKHLEVVAPPDSPFQHQEAVKVRESAEKLGGYPIDRRFIGNIGNIRGYDSRNGLYFVRFLTAGDAGWFPIQALIPLNFKGDRFYYPFEKVKYKGKEKIINKIQQSKFKWGQILMIDGEWVHASDVEPLV